MSETEKKQMNLTAIIHRRKLLVKRMQDAASRAAQYAMKPSNIVSEFGSNEEQKTAVQGTWQSVEDLQKEHLALTRALNEQNAKVTVETSKGPFTLADLVAIKQTLGGLVTAPLRACHKAAMQARTGGGFGRGADSVAIEPMFDEKERYRREQTWSTFLSEINAKLDDANTNTYVTAPSAVAD